MSEKDLLKNDIQDFRMIPKRKLGEAEKQIIILRIEKMKLEREKSKILQELAIPMKSP